MQKLRKLWEDINIWIVCYSAWKLSHLSFLGHQWFGDTFKIAPDRFEAEEVHFMILIWFEMLDLRRQLVELAQDILYLNEYLFLLVFRVLYITQCLLLKIALQE